MLEGQLVHLLVPKTHYAKDIVFDKDTPIFSTSKQPIIFIKNGVIDQRETGMMSVRWKIFHLNVRIPEEKQKEIALCPKCFATFILHALKELLLKLASNELNKCNLLLT